MKQLMIIAKILSLSILLVIPLSLALAQDDSINLVPITLENVSHLEELGSVAGWEYLGVGELTFSPDSSHILAEHGFGDVYIWDAGTFSQRLEVAVAGFASFFNIQSLNYSPDGTMFAVGGQNDDNAAQIRLFDANGDRMGTYTGSSDTSISYLVFSPNGQSLAFASTDGMVGLWPIDAEEAIEVGQHTDEALTIAFNSDGSLIVSGGADDLVQLWDVTAESLLMTFEGHTGNVQNLVFSPDDTVLASSGWNANDTLSVIIWNVETGEELSNIEGFTGNSRGFYYLEDGLVLVTGICSETRLFTSNGQDRVTCDEGTVAIWDAETGEELLTINTSPGDIFGAVYLSSFKVAFSPDRTMFAYGGQDRSIKIMGVPVD
jgi:WD40 repeat protein